MIWECGLKHKWNATYNDISKGRKCPECNCLRHKNETIIADTVKQMFPKYAVYRNYRKFNWLKSKNGRHQEIDIYVKEIKLAIEYDGEQHFKPVRFGGISKEEAKTNLKYTKKMDRLKNKKIKSHPEDVRYFIRFNYKDTITKEAIKNKLNTIIKESYV